MHSNQPEFGSVWDVNLGQILTHSLTHNTLYAAGFKIPFLWSVGSIPTTRTIIILKYYF